MNAGTPARRRRASPAFEAALNERIEARAIFVSRLERLLRMRRDYRHDLNPLGFRLLDRAIDATYRDCLDFGAAEEADLLLAQSRHND